MVAGAGVKTQLQVELANALINARLSLLGRTHTSC